MDQLIHCNSYYIDMCIILPFSWYIHRLAGQVENINRLISADIFPTTLHADILSHLSVRLKRFPIIG